MKVVVKNFKVGLVAFGIATCLSLGVMLLGGYYGPALFASLVSGLIAFFVAIEVADKK